MLNEIQPFVLFYNQLFREDSLVGSANDSKGLKSIIKSVKRMNKL